MESKIVLHEFHFAEFARRSDEVERYTKTSIYSSWPFCINAIDYTFRQAYANLYAETPYQYAQILGGMSESIEYMKYDIQAAREGLGRKDELACKNVENEIRASLNDLFDLTPIPTP